MNIVRLTVNSQHKVHEMWQNIFKKTVDKWDQRGLACSERNIILLSSILISYFTPQYPQEELLLDYTVMSCQRLWVILPSFFFVNLYVFIRLLLFLARLLRSWPVLHFSVQRISGHCVQVPQFVKDFKLLASVAFW